MNLESHTGACWRRYYAIVQSQMSALAGLTVDGAIIGEARNSTARGSMSNWQTHPMRRRCWTPSVRRRQA